MDAGAHTSGRGLSSDEYPRLRGSACAGLKGPGKVDRVSRPLRRCSIEQLLLHPGSLTREGLSEANG